jgi:2-polyprenyl-6-hydroxyphenyl methylase/3-demethylubiquinone-9 3-methyltransferase
VGDYYSQKLAAEKLEACYAIAPPRIRQYLRAEIDYVSSLVHPGASVLELGCGYGRVLTSLSLPEIELWGIDTSLASLRLAANRLGSGVRLAVMDASRLSFRSDVFDLVICVQNGISAFHVDQRRLLEESLRVVRPRGIALFSTYSDKIWPERLHWFELQAQAGLIGQIDYARTGDGCIVCRDGFTASTVPVARFRGLAEGLPAEISFEEVDQSSLVLLARRL